MNKLIVSLFGLFFVTISLTALSDKELLQTAVDETKLVDVQQLLNKNEALANAIIDSLTKKTILHWAAIGGSHDKADNNIITALLDKGANINVKDKLSATPLYDATEAGLTDVVRLLLEKGADRNIKDNHGRTPLDIAKTRKYNAIITLLTEGVGSIPSTQPALISIVPKQPLPTPVHPVKTSPPAPVQPVKHLESLAHDDIDMLQTAIRDGDIMTVEKLILKDPSLVNKKFKSIGLQYPLNLAVATEKKEIVRLLLKNGADPKLTNKQGKTPLALAQEKNFKDIIELLTPAKPFSAPLNQESIDLAVPKQKSIIQKRLSELKTKLELLKSNQTKLKKNLDNLHGEINRKN